MSNGGATWRRGLAQTQTTTVLDREHGLGLAITMIPPAAMPSGPCHDISEAGGALGLETRHRFRKPTNGLLSAALAAVMLDQNASAVVRRTERLLRAGAEEGRQQGNDALHSFVGACISAENLPLDDDGFARWSLGELVVEHAEELCVMSLSESRGTVLAAMVRLGTLLTVAPAGKRASALSVSVAEWVAPVQKR